MVDHDFHAARFKLAQQMPELLAFMMHVHAEIGMSVLNACTCISTTGVPQASVILFSR